MTEKNNNNWLRGNCNTERPFNLEIVERMKCSLFFLNRKKKSIAFPWELNFLFNVVYLSNSFFKTKRNEKNSKNQPYKYVRIHSIRI